MIKANELRIENWVLFSPSGRKAVAKIRPVCVKELHEKSFIVKDRGLDLELFYESVGSQPIPLTPEILIAAGFEYEHDQTGMRFRCKNVHMFFDGDSLSANFGHIEQLDVEIKYLHQLQNLFFALTGNELQIVLNSERKPERSVATEADSSTGDG